jgi:adenylate isopentenyltransferase (cytokinin synthase)
LTRLAAAIDEIKANTRVLVAVQAHKIRCMAGTWGWLVRRSDTMPMVLAHLGDTGCVAEAAS